MTTTDTGPDTGPVDRLPASEVISPTWGAVAGDAPGGGHQRVVSLLVPLAVAGAVCGLLLLKGRVVGAAVLAVVVTGLTVARTASPAFDRAFLRALEAFGRGVGHLLRFVLLGTMFVFVFVPLAALRWAFRGTSLGRPRGLAGDGWIPKSAMAPDGPARRTFGSEPNRAPGAKTPKLVVAVVVVAGLLVADVAVGTLFTATGVLLPIDRGDLVAQIEQSLQRDMSQPPINVEPWAQQHGRDMAAFELATNDYEPYIIRGHHDFTSPTVNVTERERVSYEPSTPGGVEPLQIAFFGGSVMFGVGQRDEHTIASEFARIAEQHGVPVDVHNYGFPAWVTWQEHQYMERLLAAGEHYDMALFLDGFNEFDVQMTDFSEEPTHHSATIFNGLVNDFRAQRATEPSAIDGLRELADSYRRNSGAWRVWDTVRGRQAPLPGAEDAVSAPPEAQTDAALDIYGRALGMIRDLGEDTGTPVRFFWQPRAAGWTPEIRDRIPEGVTDLTDVFGGDDPFYDVVHTDEPGARIIAQAMWDEVGPELMAQAGVATPGAVPGTGAEVATGTAASPPTTVAASG